MGLINHKGAVVAWGMLSQDATFKAFDSGKSVANFSVRYGVEAGEAQGRKKGLYINVSAWNQLSKYAANFEKGDHVVVFGYLSKDEYQSKKQGKDVYKILADMALVQPVADEAEAEYGIPDSGIDDSGDGDALPQGMSEMEDSDGGQLPF